MSPAPAQRLPFAIRNPAILDALEPYVVVSPFNLGCLDLAPFGLAVPAAHIIDPLRVASETFLSLLQRLDQITFGPEGMPMPRWVFFDCAELPGAIYGLGRPAAALADDERDLFGVPAGYEGLVPYSMYVALPMNRAGVWFGHNLCSIAPALRGAGIRRLDLTGLGSVTKGLALACLGVKQFWGATQWDSKALFIHSKFGPLDLTTAWTPAHSEAETLTYGFAVSERNLRASMGDSTVVLERPAADFEIHASDRDGMQDLQRRIEAGERFCVPAAPRIDPMGMFVPISELQRT